MTLVLFFFGTLPESNSEFTPDNGWLEDDHSFPFGMDTLLPGAFAVSFREGKWFQMDPFGYSMVLKWNFNLQTLSPNTKL